MSTRCFFISDLHFGHSKILEFSPERGGGSADEHDDWIVEQWNAVVGKRDVVYVLGDVAFNARGLSRCAELRGHKKLVMGNHDKFPVERYAEYFKVLPGVVRHREFWLSHAPIHPCELRGQSNIHGHMHDRTVGDPRYINVCVEQVDGKPISIEEIRERRA